MAEIESAESFVDTILMCVRTGTVAEMDNLNLHARAAIPLIEARDNAVRVALLREIDAFAKSNDARNEDWACLIKDAFEHVCAKYGAKPNE